ncbi:MAG: hypothetical protein P1V81_04810 [Planctomycetota bacterium]|nr:hypothetical protein [Planctomycetota bacterium]
MSLDERFQEYFEALDKSGSDRCYLCRRTPAEVKRFFGFHEDGTPLDADRYGIEHVGLGTEDLMSYRGTRPLCAACQLNLDTIFLADEGPALLRLLREAKQKRATLWPDAEEA